MREHESGGILVPIFIGGPCVLGLFALYCFRILVLVSVFSQVGLGLVSFLISFRLQLCVSSTLEQFGTRIPLVYECWGWGFGGLGGV